MKAPTEKLTELVGVKLTKTECDFIDRMAADGGYGSKPALIRSIIREIIKDEQRAADKPYDSNDDLTKSIDLAYDTIKDRKANGGPDWIPPTTDNYESIPPIPAEERE